MTPEHHSMLMMLGSGGRLGPFCPYPLPDGYTGDPTITPQLTDGHKTMGIPPVVGRLRLSDPGFVETNWRLLGDRLERMSAMLPSCPSCSSDDINRGATGLDVCRDCETVFRDGMTLDQFVNRSGR